ncbi:class F sortase [Pedococcus sp. NPDC057267]|uniref:class F sortase n=1 Tax=Pedococcus sp. NPDC057267 TaxID=3346077 RepID=UPI003625BC93
MAASPPTGLQIPSIGVDTHRIVDLHLDSTGKLEAPADFQRAGWYADGPTPGELGIAVIGAHVDSKAGPAVFYRLGALHPGAKVTVTRKDGTTTTFVVDQVARYSKAKFPTATVYGNTHGRAELRLITCGGAFDHTTGHYVDNIVAFAHLV